MAENPNPATRIPGPHAGEDRVCTRLGCSTILNQWHEGDRCYAHPLTQLERMIRERDGGLRLSRDGYPALELVDREVA